MFGVLLVAQLKHGHGDKAKHLWPNISRKANPKERSKTGRNSCNSVEECKGEHWHMFPVVDFLWVPL